MLFYKRKKTGAAQSFSSVIIFTSLKALRKTAALEQIQLKTLGKKGKKRSH